MVTEISFCDIKNAQLLKKEIKLFFLENDHLKLNKKEVKNRRWVYAEMEENEVQIFEEDAYNLSSALKKISCLYIYNANAEDLLQQENFEVLKSSVKKGSIQELNNYWHEIPNSDSFIFSDYPLQFLIMRPVYTEQARLYYIGEKSFIEKACIGDWWCHVRLR